MAKIKEITREYIEFEDGKTITYAHNRDCCEENYADFEQVDDIARNADFDTQNMKFELVQGSGFRFGNDTEGKTLMFFVPCYSEQNGYYSDDIDIFYDGNFIGVLECEEVRF